jgi:hypothetical protein
MRYFKWSPHEVHGVHVEFMWSSWSPCGVHGVHVEFMYSMWTPHGLQINSRWTPDKLHILQINSTWTPFKLHMSICMECIWSIYGVHMEYMESTWSSVDSMYSR